VRWLVEINGSVQGVLLGIDGLFDITRLLGSIGILGYVVVHVQARLDQHPGARLGRIIYSPDCVVWFEASLLGARLEQWVGGIALGGLGLVAVQHLVLGVWFKAV
jgi:hypothetical protein